jgi:hypothetical protein
MKTNIEIMREYLMYLLWFLILVAAFIAIYGSRGDACEDVEGRWVKADKSWYCVSEYGTEINLKEQ